MDIYTGDGIGVSLYDNASLLGVICIGGQCRVELIVGNGIIFKRKGRIAGGVDHDAIRVIVDGIAGDIGVADVTPYAVVYFVRRTVVLYASRRKVAIDRISLNDRFGGRVVVSSPWLDQVMLFGKVGGSIAGSRDVVSGPV